MDAGAGAAAGSHDGSVHTTGRRTRIKAGREEEYVAVHAEVPPAVLRMLRRCGVLRWQIWRDGRSLFHLVDTERGYDDMVARIRAHGPVDRGWDAVIADLLEPSASSDVRLPLVWTMSTDPDAPERAVQHAGAQGAVIAAGPGRG